MNEFRYDEMEIGHTEAFSAEITQEKMELFERLSGDCNPLHCEDAYARERGFPARVAYGMLTASFYSTLAGVYLPGKFCLLHEADIQFVKPVYVGDVLRISGKVAGKTDAYRLLIIQARITNQNGRLVSRAVLKAGVLDGG